MTNDILNSQGYQSLKTAVLKDCMKGNGIFNPNGCKEECSGSNCFHRYCDKFLWIIDRANHYSSHLQIPASNILHSWEKDRTYWYMNYYQECNQPLLTDKKIRVFNSVKEFRESGIEKGFRCPCCGGISKDPQQCTSDLVINGKICDWKSYGLFGTLGKGSFVYIISELKGVEIFTPIAWEESIPLDAEEQEVE